MDAVVEPVVAPNRYANGRIYKICSDLTEQVYIGSTCNPLSKRMVEHRSHHRAHLAGRDVRRMTSFEILQHADTKIILVEMYPCASKEELNARERHWIEITPNCVNKAVPGRTKAEWYIANRDAINGKKSEKHDCECGGKFTTNNRTAHLKTKKHTDWVAKNEPAAAPPAAEVEA